jgi:hypothetical protein
MRYVPGDGSDSRLAGLGVGIRCEGVVPHDANRSVKATTQTRFDKS